MDEKNVICKMVKALEKYRALSAEDRRAADLPTRAVFNFRTLDDLIEAGVEVTPDWIEEAVELGNEMLVSGFTEVDALEMAEAGR